LSNPELKVGLQKTLNNMEAKELVRYAELYILKLNESEKS